MTDDKQVFLPNHLLREYGCKNCIWKQHGFCPKGYTKPEDQLRNENNICKEMEDYLGDLRMSSRSLSEMKEKYFIYSQELQAQSDKTSFHELQSTLIKLQKNPDDNYSEIREVKMAIDMRRLWWERLSTAIIKGLGKVTDREARDKTESDRKILSADDINIVIKDARVYLQAPPKEVIDDNSVP